MNMNWEYTAWWVWIAAFAVLEAVGLWKRSKNEGMTLTYLIEHTFPKWLLACGIGWLTYHFLVDSLARG